MKIDTKIFKDFIKKKLNTTSNYLHLNITNDGVELKCVDATLVSMSESKLDKKCVTNLKPIKTKVGFNDITRLDSVMSKLGSTKGVDISITDNTIIFDTDTETHTFAIVDESTLESIPEMKLDYTDKVSFAVGIDVLKRIKDMYGTFKKENCPVIEFDIKKNTISYNIEDSGERVDSKPIPINYTGEEFKARYTTLYLINIIDCLNGDTIKVNIGKDYPIKIEEKLGDFIKSSFILAPRTDSEEESPSEQSSEETIEEDTEEACKSLEGITCR